VPSRDPTRRRRILDAAKRHFTLFGFKGTNLDVIAAEVSCAKGALYLEFADKETLLREVVEEVFTAVRAEFAAEVLTLPSPLDRLAETLRFAFRKMAAEPIFGRLLREDPELRALRPGQDPKDARTAQAEIAALRGWVDEGIAQGEIRPDVDRDAIPILIGVLRFLPQHLGIVTALGFPAERVLEGIVDVFKAGLRAREGAAPAPASKGAAATAKKTPKKAPKKTGSKKIQKRLGARGRNDERCKCD
jgi:AcrR family transcriptional regulator